MRGLRTREEACRIAKAIADSALVKTAIARGDPNWGRIISAAGYAGVRLREEDLTLSLNGTLLYKAGAPVTSTPRASPIRSRPTARSKSSSIYPSARNQSDSGQATSRPVRTLKRGLHHVKTEKSEARMTKEARNPNDLNGEAESTYESRRGSISLRTSCFVLPSSFGFRASLYLTSSLPIASAWVAVSRSPSFNSSSM